MPKKKKMKFSEMSEYEIDRAIRALSSKKALEIMTRGQLKEENYEEASQNFSQFLRCLVDMNRELEVKGIDVDNLPRRKPVKSKYKTYRISDGKVLK